MTFCGRFVPTFVTKAAISLVILFSGVVMAQTNPDVATGIRYGKWALALLPIGVGLIPHLLTLFVSAVLIRECLQKRQIRRMSGVPFVGPLFICLGLWWSPAEIPLWVYLTPWSLELLAGLALVLVKKATRATPV